MFCAMLSMSRAPQNVPELTELRVQVVLRGALSTLKGSEQAVF